MSENLDLVRSIYADLGRGFVFQAALERTHPEFEMTIADGPRAGSFKGLAGAAESFYGMLEAWDELRFEAEEYRELDDEQVLVPDHRGGRGKTSGAGAQSDTDAGSARVPHPRRQGDAARPLYGPRPRPRRPRARAARQSRRSAGLSRFTAIRSSGKLIKMVDNAQP